MENNTQSLFAAQALEAPEAFAAALAPPAAGGHFDELRGRASVKPASAQPALQRQSQSQTQLTSVPLTSLDSSFTGLLFDSANSESPAQAPAIALAAGAADSPLAPTWTTFFNFLGPDGFYDLNHRSANLQRQIRDNGVTYNVYADADGPQRPWSLDLFPMMVSAQDWAHIEAGILQRARLLDRVMADIYGPQELLAQGLLPSALVHGHPGYLRAMQGVKPAGGTYLHIAAFDIAHGPAGEWSVVSQRTQAPSGLGYLLENRLTISLLFPEAFREMKVQRLAASYKALVDGLRAMSPDLGADAGSRVVLLTPGPYNETYFEHAYLARFLGLTLVEGSDLMVRDQKLFLKTLQGLEPVHGLLKRLDDEFLDPLELRSDSTLGVPGLLQVIRAGNVLVVNTPGSAFLESTAMLGFLPALSEHLLGETLALPSLATWWCGEQAVMRDVLSQLKDCVIKPTYPGSGMESVIGHTLSRRELDEWAGRIVRQGEDYTVQAYLPLSQTPTWQGEKISPRSAMLRVFAVADGNGSWQVLPGGLARLAGNNENMASMQHGGSSADVWVLGNSDTASGATAKVTPYRPAARGGASGAAQFAPDWAKAPPGHRPPVTSRAAENLFWLGRYTERAENSTRLARLTLQCLGGEDQASVPLLAWLSRMAVSNALVLHSVPHATQARRVFERALIANLADTSQAASVGANLRALKSAASAVRERLSQEQWHVIVRAEADFFQRCEEFGSADSADLADGEVQHALAYSSVEALRALESVSGFLAAMTGAQSDRMTRDDGWRLLSAGRLIERLYTLASALAHGFETEAVFDEGGFNAMVALFDSTITFHAQYQQRRDIPALLDLLVLDRDNPRSLGWVVQTLRGRLAKLADHTPGDFPDPAMNLPDPDTWALAEWWGSPKPEGQPEIEARLEGGIKEGEGVPGTVAKIQPGSDTEIQAAQRASEQKRHCQRPMQLLEQCGNEALELSDALSRRYFSHAAPVSYSLGA